MKEEKIELIDQYLNGELSATQAAAVEQEMKTDPQFAAAVALQREVFASLTNHFQREKQEAALKDTLGKESPQHFRKQGGGRVVRMLYAVAAVAAVLLIFIWSPWQQSLLDEYYSTPSLALTARGGDQSCETTKIDQQYRNRQFADALPLLDACLSLKPNDAELQFAKAICLLETEETNAALLLLEDLKTNETFKYEALWYSAMAHLKSDNKEAAARLLEQIPADEDHGSDAAELLKHL